MNNDDIICTCMSVSVMDIRNAIKQGAKTFHDVQVLTGIGTVCGVCTDDAEMTINQLLNAHEE